MNEKKRILIAGATGLIGKEIVKQCLEASIAVNYLTTSKEKIVNEDGYQGFYWNPSKNEIDSKAFVGVSAIINLAGATVSKRWTKRYKEIILESRVQTAKVLYDFLKSHAHEVSHYLSASGVSIYPSSKRRLYAESETDISDSFLGEVTVAWEAAADRFSDLNVKVSKVRTGVVLDEDGGALPQMVKPIKYGVGAPLGSGKQWLSWIHIEDIAGIYLFLLKEKFGGVFNGVAPSPVTNCKLTKIIASQLDKPLWLPKVPGFMLRLLLGEMGDLVLESQLVSAQKLEAQGYRYRYVNVEKAIEDLL